LAYFLLCGPFGLLFHFKPFGIFQCFWPCLPFLALSSIFGLFFNFF
jgi:hypothetical protein